jgi:hypothetical protein
MVVYAFLSSYVGSMNRMIVVQACLGINVRLYLKNKTKMAGGMAQVVEHLSKKHKAQSSASSTTKKLNTKYHMTNS